MKTLKIVYWSTTILFAALFTMSTVMYLTQNVEISRGMEHLGYPLYLMQMLGIAKGLGIIALIQTKFKTLQEWAYAGFTINIIGAVWSHAAVGDPFMMPLVFLMVLGISYYVRRMISERKSAKNSSAVGSAINSAPLAGRAVVA